MSPLFSWQFLGYHLKPKASLSTQPATKNLCELERQHFMNSRGDKATHTPAVKGRKLVLYTVELTVATSPLVLKEQGHVPKRTVPQGLSATLRNPTSFRWHHCILKLRAIIGLS